MEAKSNLCFSTFVFGSYQKYIPYYIYSIAHTYPEACVKVIVDELLKPDITAILSFLKTQIINRFEIVEMTDTNTEEYTDYKIQGGGKKLLRWLIPNSMFTNCKYVYFGDVDILILRENDQLNDFHITQLNKFNLPFSNKVRVDSFNKPVKRMTGLHFIDVINYYKTIQPIIDKIKSDSEYRKEYLADLHRDENLLYKMNKEAFMFDEKELIHAKRPWHGLHLGITRGNKNIDLKTIEENSSLSIDEITKQLKTYLDDPVFKKIQNKVFVIELFEILKQLKISTPFLWKLKALNYRLSSKIHSIYKRIKRSINA